MRNTRKSQCIGNFVGIECLNMVFFGDNTNGVGITKSVSHPSPLDAGALGISHAARAFSLPARRGDLPHCVRHIPSRSPRGPLQSCGKSRSCADGAAIPFMPKALQKQAFDGLGHKRNQHRVAMLTP